MGSNATIENLAQLLVDEGIDSDALAEAVKAKTDKPNTKAKAATKAKTTKRRTTRRKTAKTKASTFDAVVAKAKAKDEAKAKTRKAKYQYGQAPTVKDDPEATIEAREDDLEQRIPGILTEAFVFHSGRLRSGKISRGRGQETRRWEGPGWTWVELPDKKATVGGMKAREVRAALAAAGYGWSPANKLWATDSGGRPCRRSPHYKARGVGRELLNEDE